MRQYEHVIVTRDARALELDGDDDVHAAIVKGPKAWDRTMSRRAGWHAVQASAMIMDDPRAWMVVPMFMTVASSLDLLLNAHNGRWIPICYLGHVVPALGVWNESSLISCDHACYAYSARSGTYYAALHHNNSEFAALAQGQMKFASAVSPRTFRMHAWTYDPSKEPPRESKRDLILYGGRLNPQKAPADAFKILSALGGGFERIVTAPYASGAEINAYAKSFEQVKGIQTIIPCGKEEYVAALTAAKVCLICSTREGYPIGYLEAAQQGALWVVRRKPWAEDLLGPDWPLFWKKPEEAIEKCVIAIEQYDDLIAEQRRRLALRHSEPFDLHRVFDGVAQEHIAERTAVAARVELWKNRWEQGIKVGDDSSEGATHTQNDEAWIKAEGLRHALGLVEEDPIKPEDMKRHVIRRAGEWLNENPSQDQLKR